MFLTKLKCDDCFAGVGPGEVSAGQSALQDDGGPGGGREEEQLLRVQISQPD